jgi:hypothetical protein
MEFVRSVIINDETPAADGTYTYDLPVNPLSHISLTIKALNVTDEAAWSDLLDMVTSIQVLHRGMSVFSLSAADLFTLDTLLLRGLPLLSNLVATDNATRWFALTIPFGRRLWDPNECFPDSKAGELQLQLTVDIATAEADGLILLCETTELIGARPSRNLKVTTHTKTPAATGVVDIDLPIRNEYAGILLYSTTKPTGTAWTTTIDDVKLLADNVELNYSLSKWEALRGDQIIRSGMHTDYEADASHDHLAHYALLDFSPNNEDTFLVQTKNMSSFKLKVTAGDTNAIRCLPIELQTARKL